MSVGDQITALANSQTGKAAIVAVISAVLGWVGATISAWWKGRDRYQAFVTWQTTETMRGHEEQPVIVIQSIHDQPINVTGLRVRNGFRWHTREWPFDSEDPDYPQLPLVIEPKQAGRLWLSEHALTRAAEQSRLLNWLWVPRVYIGVKTMGRGERLFVAEGALSYKFRRRRFQR